MHVYLPFAFQKNDFFNIGVYVVLSIAYGGKGYPFLAEPVFDYISTERYNIAIPEEDIPDASLKSIVSKVCLDHWMVIYKCTHPIAKMCRKQ